MSFASPKSTAPKVTVCIEHTLFERLNVYCEKYGITVEEAANDILQNFFSEESSINEEPGRTEVLNDEVYNYLRSEFMAGLASASDESDWITEEGMMEFVNNLKSN